MSIREYLLSSLKKKMEKAMADYGDETQAVTEYGGLMKSSHPPSIRTRITARINDHEKQVAKLKELLELLDRNPDIEKFQDLSQRVHL